MFVAIHVCVKWSMQNHSEPIRYKLQQSGQIWKMSIVVAALTALINQLSISWKEVPVDSMALCLYRLTQFYVAEITRGRHGVGDYHLRCWSRYDSMQPARSSWWSATCSIFPSTLCAIISNKDGGQVSHVYSCSLNLKIFYSLYLASSSVLCIVKYISVSTTGENCFHVVLLYFLADLLVNYFAVLHSSLIRSVPC